MLTKEKRNELIERVAERMRYEAETGLKKSVLKQINFRSLAVSAVLELEYEMKNEIL